jgi:hypothetical protein
VSSSLNNRGASCGAMRLMARSSVKIAWHKPKEMFTPQQSPGSLNADRREFFHALELPFVHCGLLKVGLDADRLLRILDPL